MILKIISKNEQCITSAFKTITKKTHEFGATLLRLKNFPFSFVYDPRMHQMQLLNLCLILYYFETHLLSYLSLAQHTIQLCSVLYFSHSNLPIIPQTKNPTKLKVITIIQITNELISKLIHPMVRKIRLIIKTAVLGIIFIVF